MLTYTIGKPYEHFKPHKILLVHPVPEIRVRFHFHIDTWTPCTSLVIKVALLMRSRGQKY